MKISRDRFEELVSAYLDNELSDAERELLSRCVCGNRQMAAMFRNACRIHAATCAMYGKKAVFSKLEGVEPVDFTMRKPSKTAAVAEWTGVAALMALSVVLMFFAVDFGTPVEKSAASARSENTESFPQIASVVSEQIDFQNGVAVGVIRIVGQSPLVPSDTE